MSSRQKNSLFIFMNGLFIFMNGLFIFVNSLFIFVNSLFIFINSMVYSKRAAQERKVSTPSWPNFSRLCAVSATVRTRSGCDFE